MYSMIQYMYVAYNAVLAETTAVMLIFPVLC
jgi:hypothetical protein